MMKNINEIYIDFKRARKAAEELEEMADRLGKISETRLSQTMEKISASWKCPSSDSFRGKEECLQALIAGSEKSVRSIATQVRKEAQRLYETEKRAYEIASTRTS